DRGEARVPALRRADVGTRPGERGRDGRADRAAPAAAQRHERGGVARCARLLQGGRPDRAAARGADPPRRSLAGIPRDQGPGGARVPGSRLPAARVGDLMELRYKGEAMVGTLLIVGVATFVGLLMWLQGKQWRSGDLVHVTFESVTGLKEGDPVRTSGVRVGNVKTIRLVTPG